MEKTHYAWYKSKIKRGEITVPGFDDIDINETDENNSESEIFETIDASISLEKDLHSYLATRINEIENGLTLVDDGVEYQTDAGQIDILANDANGNFVVIALKAGKAKDNAVGQLLGYMGCIATNQNTRGILVASDFDKRVVYASKGLKNIKLLKYNVSFELQEIT